MIAVTRMKDFLPFRSVVFTVNFRWTAIKIQIVRMKMVGMMNAKEHRVQSQVFLKFKTFKT